MSKVDFFSLYFRSVNKYASIQLNCIIPSDFIIHQVKSNSNFLYQNLQDWTKFVWCLCVVKVSGHKLCVKIHIVSATSQ